MPSPTKIQCRLLLLNLIHMTYLIYCNLRRDLVIAARWERPNCWNLGKTQRITIVNHPLLLKGTHLIRRKSLKSTFMLYLG
ncbi:hypothetical protein Hanom_Chr04g00385421 [Helianthus anomalus]